MSQEDGMDSRPRVETSRAPEAPSSMEAPAPYYFDDLCAGYTERSPGRTIGEYEISAFAGLSGDYNQLHTDRLFAARTAFGAPVAHGLLGLAVASGLYTRTDLGLRLQPATIALMDVAWTFTAPIFAGDTVWLHVRLSELIPTRSGRRGIVTMDRWLESSRSEQAQQGQARLLIARRPATDDGEA